LLVSATANEIVAIVPAPPTAGTQVQAPIVVQARGGTSSGGIAFVVNSPSEASFRPRYFPAAAADRPSEDVVLVSTELGPALLLSGKLDVTPVITHVLGWSEFDHAVELQRSGKAGKIVLKRDRP